MAGLGTPIIIGGAIVVAVVLMKKRKAASQPVGYGASTSVPVPATTAIGSSVLGAPAAALAPVAGTAMQVAKLGVKSAIAVPYYTTKVGLDVAGKAVSAAKGVISTVSFGLF